MEMEMNGGTSASHLSRTPCVPLFCTLLIGVEAEGLADYQGRAGIISIARWNLRPVSTPIPTSDDFLCGAGNCSGGSFCPDQAFNSEEFLFAAWLQTEILSKDFWGLGWGSQSDPQEAVQLSTKPKWKGSA